MTTATDWDVRDADTGSHPVVTDVTSAAPEHAIELRTAHALAVRNADLSEQVRHLTDLVERLTEDKRVAHLELDRLHAEVDGSRSGWTPRRDVNAITGVGHLTQRQQNAALVAPTADDLGETDRDGMPLTPILATYEWPTWLGDVHHADATVTDAVTSLHAWADSYTANPIERTVVEPVQVDTSYRQTEAWALADLVVGQSRQSVYAELAPERIQANSKPQQNLPIEHERQPEDQEALDKLTKRVPTAISAPTVNSDHNAVTTPHEPDGWLRRTWNRVFDAVFPYKPAERRERGA